MPFKDGGFLAGDGATASEVIIIMSIIPSDTYKHKQGAKRKKTKSTQSPTLVYQVQCTHVCSAPNPAVQTPQDLSQAMQNINPNVHGTSPPNAGGWSTQSLAGV